MQLHHARTARDVLTHRGPDQAGEWLEKGVYLGHRRLSILDTSDAGRQPMAAGEVAVTVNGEIYNFQSLRSELVAAGYQFASHSDSEVVLHGYRHWGIDGLLERMDGMYAGVIHDGRLGRLLAFRDRAGVKPLYYYHRSGEQLVWASELKAIKHFVPPRRLAINPEAILDFLTYRYIPAPRSLYKNCFKLPAASLLECDLADMSLRIRRYWNLSTEPSALSEAKMQERLLELLESSVREQLVSDVPLGILLSGGIDSSAVAAVAGREQSGIQSFSIGFRQSGRDETPFAEAMAKRAQTYHRVHYLEDEEMSGLLDRMHAWFDEPFGDTSAIPTHRVCSFARDHVKVALSGDGGDELFGGYRWYQRYADACESGRLMPVRLTRGLRLPPRLPWARKIEWASINDPVWLYALIRGSLPYKHLCAWKERLGIPKDYDELWAYRAHYNAALPARKAAQVMDFHTYLPDDILTKVDRVSMSVSLECRPVLLSRKLIEFAFSLDETLLYRSGQLKGGLKQALSDLLPESVLSHAKQGFSVPDFGWKKTVFGAYGTLQESMAEPYLNGRKFATQANLLNTD